MPLFRMLILFFTDSNVFPLIYNLAACQLTSECGQDEICLAGQCINPCHQESACGMNSECLMSSHVKQCTCPPGFTGNAAVECVRSES